MGSWEMTKQSESDGSKNGGSGQLSKDGVGNVDSDSKDGEKGIDSQSEYRLFQRDI